MIARGASRMFLFPPSTREIQKKTVVTKQNNTPEACVCEPESTPYRQPALALSSEHPSQLHKRVEKDGIQLVGKPPLVVPCDESISKSDRRPLGEAL